MESGDNNSFSNPPSRQKSALSKLLERQEKEISNLIRRTNSRTAVDKKDKIVSPRKKANQSPLAVQDTSSRGSSPRIPHAKAASFKENVVRLTSPNHQRILHRQKRKIQNQRKSHPLSTSASSDDEHILSIFVNPHHSHYSAIRKIEQKPSSRSPTPELELRSSPALPPKKRFSAQTPCKMNSYVVGRGSNSMLFAKNNIAKRRKASAQIFGTEDDQQDKEEESITIKTSLGRSSQSSLGSRKEDEDIDSSDSMHDNEGETVESCAIKNLAPGVAINPDVEIRTLRGKIVFFIHSNRTQAILLLLLLLDVMLVIAELVLQSHNICTLKYDPASCLNVPVGAFPLSEVAVENDSGYFPPTGCGVFGDAVVPHALHEAEIILVWCSRGILLIFALELIVLVMCLGRYFFTVLYTIDSIIITTSLVLSFVFDGNLKDESATALIIFLRCWRFARVLHGFGITIHNWEDQQERSGIAIEDELEEGHKSLHRLSQRHRDELIAYCDELEHLREKLIRKNKLQTDCHFAEVDPLAQTSPPISSQ